MSSLLDQSAIPIDVLRTDEQGEIDLEQLEHNLSLTPEQRLDQYMQWLEFLAIAREAGKQYYGVDPRPAETAE